MVLQVIGPISIWAPLSWYGPLVLVWAPYLGMVPLSWYGPRPLVGPAPMALTESQVVILYFFWIKYNYIDQSVVCAANSFHMIHENTLLKSGFLGIYRTMGWL